MNTIGKLLLLFLLFAETLAGAQSLRTEADQGKIKRVSFHG